MMTSAQTYERIGSLKPGLYKFFGHAKAMMTIDCGHSRYI